MLARAELVRHRIVRAENLCLNETGFKNLDVLTPEYNNLLADRRHTETLPGAVIDWLCRMRADWDELRLSGVDDKAAEEYRNIASRVGLTPILRDSKRTYRVDLDAVRASGGDFLEMLSRNTRHQIRRAIRIYEADGPLTLARAQTTDEASRFFDELKELHQTYWESRDLPGSFANPFFEQFHRDLINRCVETGHIMLVRVTSGERPIGYIYNFVDARTVYQYQSGFCYDNDPKLKPGLVSHYLAIEHCLESDIGVYDFMAGESQHKKSLGIEGPGLEWMTLQRNRLKYRIENGLRDVKHRLTAPRAA